MDIVELYKNNINNHTSIVMIIRYCILSLYLKGFIKNKPKLHN